MRKNSTQPDHFFTLLNTEIEKERAMGGLLSARFYRLALLMALHVDDKKGGFEAWRATLIAGRLRIPAPIWAIDLLEKVERDALEGVTKKSETFEMDTLLGFKGRGKGGTKNSSVQQSRQAKQREELCCAVRLLISVGQPLETACTLVALKFKSLTKPETRYTVRAPNAETLKGTYKKWEEERGEDVLSAYDTALASISSQIKQKILQIFR